MSDRAGRMAFLLRQNDGRRRLPELRAALAERLGRPVAESEILPLHRGDALWERVLPAIRACWPQGPPAFSRWASRDLQALGAGVLRLAETTGTAAVLYLPAPATGIGPVRVAFPEIAPHVRALAETDTEQCTITTADGDAGLRLHYEAGEHARGAEYPYELTIWGPGWQHAARAAVPFELAAPSGRRVPAADAPPIA